MYVFVGCKGRSVRHNVAVIIDKSSKSDAEALCYCFDSLKDNEEVSYVEIWDDNEGQLICGIDL